MTRPHHGVEHREGTLRLHDGRRLRWESLGGARDRPLLLPGGRYFLRDLALLVRGRRHLIAYDLRNRGESDAEIDSAIRARGIAQDVDDLSEVRDLLELGALDLLAHSYMAHIVAHGVRRQPAGIGRVVLLSPSPPDPASLPPATAPDETATRVLAELACWRATLPPTVTDPIDSCRAFWRILQPLYVADPQYAAMIDWGRCELPNERGFLQYFTAEVAPSIAREPLDAARLAHVTIPLLVVHGREDRSAPFAGAGAWARIWPRAQLLALDHVGHAPWLEAPDRVRSALAQFLVVETPPRTDDP